MQRASSENGRRKEDSLEPAYDDKEATGKWAFQESIS